MGHLKAINFPFVPNVKLIIFKCPTIWTYYSLIIMCSNIETPKIINFPFGTNGKLMVLGVPIFKHFRVLQYQTLNKPFTINTFNGGWLLTNVSRVCVVLGTSWKFTGHYQGEQLSQLPVCFP